MKIPKLFRKGDFGALAWDEKNGFLAAFNREDACIQVFSPAGGQQEYVVNGRPGAMCFDAYGRLLFCDREQGAVVRNDYYGPVSFAAEYQGEATGPKAIAVHSCGAYFMLGSRALYCIIPEGRTLLDACGGRPLAYAAMCLAPDEAGLLFSRTEDGRIIFSEFNLEGKLGLDRTFVYGNGLWTSGPEQLCTDAAGNLYCGGQEGLFIFNRWGRYLGHIDCKTVSGLCVDVRHGRLYLALAGGIYWMEVESDA